MGKTLKVGKGQESTDIMAEEESAFWAVPEGLEDHRTALDYLFEREMERETGLWEEQISASLEEMHDLIKRVQPKTKRRPT